MSCKISLQCKMLAGLCIVADSMAADRYERMTPLSLPIRTGLAALFVTFFGLVLYIVFFCPEVKGSQLAYYTLGGFEELPFETAISQIRSHMFHQGNLETAYLDWARKALFTDQQIGTFVRELSQNLYGNTHSESESSERSMDLVDDLRRYITRFFGSTLSSHVVIFTHSQAQAIKTIVEAFPFKSNSKFMYSTSSSADIIGLRGIATAAGATSEVFSQIPDPQTFPSGTINLVAFPLVDQFDGTTLSEEDMTKLATLNASAPGNVITVADATAFIPGGKLDLSKFKFDAVVFDCEKLFGFPKLGILVMRSELVWILERPYFGGGTLVYALTSRSKEKMRLRPSERFEDGSLPFLNMVAVDKGFKLLDTLGWNNITKHTETIMKNITTGLNNITYEGGKKAVQIYGTNHRTIVSFNVIDENGNVRDYREVLKSAQEHDIVLSGGCQDVPGTCMKTFNVDESALAKEMKRPDCGVLRVSIGWATSESDVDKLMKWLWNFTRNGK